MNTKKAILVILIISIIPFIGFAQNYAEVLQKAVWFFDANKCGPDAGTNNVFSSWRGACHTADGADVGADLCGGFHDAGDHVKFGLPQGYSAAVLGWALYEYREEFDAAGITPKLLATLKYFTDYFLKCKIGSTFYYQLGDGVEDHTYWGPPELQSITRVTYAKADVSTPATDVLGEVSAALSLMYLNYQSTNATYANQCLTLARDLYNMAKSNLGYGDGQSYYQSSSYYDDLSWAATWLYVIDGTASLLTDINSYLSNPTKNGDLPLVKNHWTMCWDDMGLAVLTKLTLLTGNTTYKAVVEENLTYWMNTLETTPGGLKYLHYWGVLRYAAAESMIMLLYYEATGNSAYYNFAKSQIDYILEDNPMNMSYVIDYGTTWALHPHHRAANGYTYVNNENTLPAQHTLTGALVGGPDQSDNYLDDVNQYQYTEVAIDYNAGFVGALAGMYKFAGGVIPTTAPTTPPSVTVEPTSPPVDTIAPTTPPTETIAPTDVPTATPAPTDTPAPTAVPTATPAGATADPTTGPDTPAPTDPGVITPAPTDPPSVTSVPTDAPTTPPVETTAPGGCTCTNLCSSQTAITVPFTYDGSGEYCWTAAAIGSYINSWNTDSVNVNGTNCTNTYTASSSIAAISGVYYIYYKASYSWSHVEIK